MANDSVQITLKLLLDKASSNASQKELEAISADLVRLGVDAKLAEEALNRAIKVKGSVISPYETLTSQQQKQRALPKEEFREFANKEILSNSNTRTNAYVQETEAIDMSTEAINRRMEADRQSVADTQQAINLNGVKYTEYEKYALNAWRTSQKNVMNEEEFNASLKKTGQTKLIQAQNDKQMWADRERAARVNYMSMRRLGEVGRLTFAAGAAMIGSLIAPAMKYAKVMGDIEVASSKWNKNSKQIEYANIRIGRVATETLLPVYEEIVKAMQAVATILENNPLIAKVILWTGATVGGFGAIVTGLSVVGRVIFGGAQLWATAAKWSANRYLLSAGIMKNASDGNMVAATGMQAASKTFLLGAGKRATWGSMAGTTSATASVGTLALGGLALVGISAGILKLTEQITVPLGVSIGNAIGKLFAGEKWVEQAENDWVTTNRRMQSLAMEWVLDSRTSWSLINDNTADSIQKWWDTVYLGIKPKESTTTVPVNGYGTNQYGVAITEDMVKAYRDYDKQIADLRDKYGKDKLAAQKKLDADMLKLADDYAKRMKERSDDYILSVQRASRDYNQNESDIERKYLDDRLKQAKDYAKKLLEMEQDHQIEMRRDLEDHEDAQRSLLESRDGLAMFREDERYEKERQRKEEDYQLEVGRLSQEAAEDYKRREDEFAAERLQRREQFIQRMSDQAEDFNIESARLAAEKEIREKELQDSYNEQIKSLYDVYTEQGEIMAEAFREKMRSLDPYILGDYVAFQTKMMEYAVQFRNWLASAIASTSSLAMRNWMQREREGGATGGYFGYGTYQLGEEGEEFLLNADSTKAAERMIGNRLTQSNLLASMIGNRSGMVSGRSGGYVDNRVMSFGSGVTESDRASIRREMIDVTQEILRDVMENN